MYVCMYVCMRIYMYVSVYLPRRVKCTNVVDVKNKKHAVNSSDILLDTNCMYVSYLYCVGV